MLSWQASRPPARAAVQARRVSPARRAAPPAAATGVRAAGRRPDRSCGVVHRLPRGGEPALLRGAPSRSTGCSCPPASGARWLARPRRKRRSIGSGSTRALIPGGSNRRQLAQRGQTHGFEICPLRARRALRVPARRAMTCPPRRRRAAQTARPGALQMTVVDPERRRDRQRDRHRRRGRSGHEGADARAGADQRAGRGERGRPAAGPLLGARRVSRLRDARCCPRCACAPSDNKQVMMLPIAGVQDTVTVERRQAGDGRRSPVHVRHRAHARAARGAVGRSRHRCAQQLQDMAGPGAVIKVDSFEGAALPPKAHDPLDPHLARSVRGREPLGRRHRRSRSSRSRASARSATTPAFRFRGGRLSGRSPFTPTRGPEQMRNYMIGG